MKNYSGRNAASARKYSGADSENFSRSRAALKFYSYGSAAAKIEEARDEVSLKYYGELSKIEKRSVVRGSAAKFLCALIICSCAIFMIFIRSMVYNYQLENSGLQKKLDTEREKTVSLTAQSTEKIDLAYVEQAALTRLNMAKPQSYQIVYIEVPKTDFTVNHEAPTVVEKEKAMIVSYKNFASGIKEAREVFLPKKVKSGAVQK